MTMTPTVNPRQITQTPAHIALYAEDGPDLRIIPFGGARTPPALRSRDGSSTARWEADALVIDTTNLTIHQLKNQLTEIFSESGANDSMQVSVVSFGYKHGIPLDVDLVFDVRFLPNPHWDENLRQLSGLDEAVRDYVIGNELTAKFLSHLESLLQFLLP
ncbi:MAG: hypothetical protein ACKOEH_01970, partial [Actinomycetota bacterium]